MSANDAIAAERLPGAERRAFSARLAALARSADALALVALGFFVVVLAAISWRKWGTPEIDAGAELTTAAQAAHGHLPYEDVRYFYGPLGVYTLTGAFKLLGTSLATAYALGLATTAAIAGSFYALARQLLRPLAASLSTAVLIAIGFSGTQFNFILPHTNSATFGLLLLILTLLALARGHFLLAGTAIGLTALTRVEFAAAAGLAGLAWAVGIWREEDLRAALRALAWMAGPALAIPLAVLGALAAGVGADRLFWQNLWPIDFLRAAGFNAYREWTPFDAASVASSLARGAIYLALLAGLTATAVRLHGARGIGRAKALWPLAAACLASLALLGFWKASGVFPDAQAAVQEEGKQMLLGMSWLPLLSLLAGGPGIARTAAPPEPPR